MTTERDPVRAALADQLELYKRAYIYEWKCATPALSWADFETIIAALRAHLPGRFDCGALVIQWRQEAHRHRTAQADCDIGDDDWFLHNTEADRLNKCASELSAALPPTLGCDDLPKPETMLTYASILEKPQYWVDPNGRKWLLATGEIVEAACAALRYCAALPPTLNSGALAERLRAHAEYLDQEECGGTFSRDLMDASRILALPRAVDGGGALKSLSNEISGWLSVYEPDLRAAMGNTNFAVMEHKLAEANVALLKTDVEYHRGYAAGVADQIETQEYDRNIAEALPPTLNSGALTEDQIKHMVDRFLGWKLPENFSPDAGISFKPTFNDHLPTPQKHNPSGTNLFDAVQADAMVRYLIEGVSALPRAVDGGAAGEREAAIHDALLGLIEAVELDSDTGGKGISGYTAARLHDARETLSAFPRSERSCQEGK